MHLSLWKQALAGVPDDVWDRTDLQTLVLAIRRPDESGQTPTVVAVVGKVAIACAVERYGGISLPNFASYQRCEAPFFYSVK
jgi:hypothetical protein